MVALSANALMRIESTGVYRSEDGGMSWREVTGALGVDGRIYCVSQQDEALLLLWADEEGRAQVLRFEPSHMEATDTWSVERMELDQGVSRFEVMDVREIVWMSTRLVLRTPTHLWEVPRYQRSTRQSRSVMVLMTALVSMIVVSIFFVVLKGYGRKKRTF